MHLYSKKKSSYLTLYNKIVSLTRKNFFYYDIKLVDSFETRIYLIFFHISIIFIILNIKKFDKSISQKIFDFFFSEIENNLRELGYGDTKINNEMKKLVKSFYGILIICKISLISFWSISCDFILICSVILFIFILFIA